MVCVVGQSVPESPIPSGDDRLRRGGSCRRGDAINSSLFVEMLSHTFIHLFDRRSGRGYVAQRVQEYEVVDRSVVAHGVDLHTGVLQLSRVGLTVITQRIS